MVNEKKHTSKEAATAASKVLRDGRTSGDSKSAGGSALSQADKKTNKTTGDAAADKSSKVLQNKETGKNSKKAAGSALSQKESKKK